MNYAIKRSILAAALPSSASIQVSTMGGVTTQNSLEDYDRSWPNDQSQSIEYPHRSICQSNCAKRLSNVASCLRPAGSDLIRTIIEDICQAIPPSIGVQITIEDRFVHIAKECE
jgi:hypothetical protein